MRLRKEIPYDNQSETIRVHTDNSAGVPSDIAEKLAQNTTYAKGIDQTADLERLSQFNRALVTFSLH